MGTCTIAKPISKMGGRIIYANSTSQDHGQMASASRRNFLVCFYCNTKSAIRYDGLMTEWKCGRCEAINYLDQNGDITDPPVATDHASPANIKYSFSREDSPLSDTSSQPSRSSPFCARCLQNQHLYITSLQQYYVELDPSHPEYKESERKYYKFRKNLEKRYPQVCEDCLPNYEKGLEDARKKLKSDVMRRSLANSKLRARKAMTGITPARIRDFIGQSLWCTGFICQLLWHIIALVAIANHHVITMPDYSVPDFVPPLLSTLTEVTSLLPMGNSLGRWGLMCSFASFWWSPKFNNLTVGFTTHITGYKYWYKHQLIMLVVRCLFYFVMANKDFADSLHSAVGAAHIFILVFITFLAIRAHTFIRVDVSRLWSHAPPKLPYIGPGSSPKQSENKIRDALNEMGLNRSRLNEPKSRPISPPYVPYKPEPYEPGSIRIGKLPTGPLLPLKVLNVPPSRSRNSPAFNNTISPSHENQLAVDQQYSEMNVGGMDWAPEPPQPRSQHRAFTENLPVSSDAVFFGQAQPQKNSKLFGQTPVVPQPSTFWYKIPPAPIAPAHQLRNPQNQPRMRTISTELKQNFFISSKKPPSAHGPPETPISEIEFSQQKFFAPEPASKEHEVLVSAFDGWSLRESDGAAEAVSIRRTGVRRHILQGIALLVALIFWNQAHKSPSEHIKNTILPIMLGCLCIGARTVLDNTIYTLNDKDSAENALTYTIGTVLGGFECTAACFGISSILGGTECVNCDVLGTILLGGMIVHEMWIASFG